MKWESRLALSFTAIMMWFVAAGYFSESRIMGDPEGVDGALVGVFVVGPVVSGLYIWSVVSIYRSQADQQKASRVLGIAVIIPIALFALGFLLFD